MIKEKNAATNHDSHLLREKPKATHPAYVPEGSFARFLVEKHLCKRYNFAKKRTAELTQSGVSKALKSSWIIYPAFHRSVADSRPSEPSLHHPKQFNYCPCCCVLGRRFLFKDNSVFLFQHGTLGKAVTSSSAIGLLYMVSPQSWSTLCHFFTCVKWDVIKLGTPQSS